MHGCAYVFAYVRIVFILRLTSDAHQIPWSRFDQNIELKIYKNIIEFLDAVEGIRTCIYFRENAI